jgi:hypothetical protein
MRPRCIKKVEGKPRWECPPSLNQTKCSNENRQVTSIADLTVVTKDVQQVGSTDYAIPIRIVIPTVREAPVESEYIEDVRGGDQAIAIDVSGTGGVVVGLVKALREVLIWDADRSSDGLADRSVEVNAAVSTGMETGSDGVASEDRLRGHLFGEQPAPGEQHGEE